MIYLSSVKLSVIIPCKNEATTLPALLESLSRQTHVPDEILVVDSHSTDDTVSIAKSYQESLPITLVTAKKRGVAEARNAGGEVASSDVLLFVDADATFPPVFIKTFLREKSRRKLTAGGFSQRMPSTKKGLEFGAHFMNLYAKTMQYTPWPIAYSCIFSDHSVFKSLHGFDAELFIMEDYDYVHRAKRAGNKIGIVSVPFLASDRRFIGPNRSPIWHGIYGELYRYTHGLRITKPIYQYSMGGKKSQKK
jgi:glycosyltransferase involved in cell wall biosynthesis